MIRFFALVLLPFFVSLAAHGEPLTTAFTYQGELRSEGAPAQGEYDFEFTLHLSESVDNAVTLPLTADDVLVADGVFSVPLDFGFTPFTGDRLWIEIGVRNGQSTGSFTTLAPRQELTAAPYALHSEAVAANAVGTLEIEDASVTTADLEDGAVTASKIAVDSVTGAAISTDAVTSDHIVDGALTAADLGNQSVTSSKLAAGSVGSVAILNGAVGGSKIDSSEVQARVTGSCPGGTFMTAVGAPGTVSCGVDQAGVDSAGAVAAILSADGSGSGLDADQLDGMESSELIDATRIGTAITTTPITLTASGRYYFTDNIVHTGSAHAIRIAGDDITVDMNGFTLSGLGATANSSIGFRIQLSDRAVIRNGTIRDFGGSGITGTSSTNNRISSVTIIDVGETGIELTDYAGIIENCIVSGAAQIGIEIEQGRLSGSVITNNEFGVVARDSVVTDNLILNNAATGLTASDSVLRGNTVAENGAGPTSVSPGGIHLTRSVMVGNTVRDNAEWNIQAVTSGLIADNYIAGATADGAMGGYGIEILGSRVVARDNVLEDNAGSPQISIPPGFNTARLVDNLEF